MAQSLVLHPKSVRRLDFNTELADALQFPGEESVLVKLENEGVPYLEEEGLRATLEKYNYLEGNDQDDNVSKALDQAKKSHGNQIREIGGSYLTQHIYPVTKNAVEYGAQRNGNVPLPEYLPIIALLHDCVEDDPNVSLEDIEEMFEGDLGNIVRHSLDGLTKPDRSKVPGENELEKREYIESTMIEKLENAEKYLGTVELYYIKGLDRINNFQCLPVPDVDKTIRICRNTETIFEPWLNGRDPVLADVLKRKRENVEQIIGLTYRISAN